MIKKITNFILENKKNVLISLFIGIFLLYIQPIILFLNKQIIDFLLLISVKFSNYYFLSVAKNNLDKNTEYRSMILCLFFLCLMVVFYKGIKVLEKKYDNKANDIKKEKKEKEVKRFLKYKTFFKIFLILWGAYLYFIIIFNINVDALNLKFRNNLVITSTFVENSEINNLKYKWLIMKNKNDFIKINNEIENIYKKNNIEENQNFKFNYYK
ncbi:hypothetical protein KAJ61_03280 [Candidatus Parcubacteria bacterium]|nr:hypothetical protein [Candidatus Parcubacteria bacterium]